MASKRERRITLRNMPYRPGLATAGQQTTVPESEAWQLSEAASDLDGMPVKRAGLTQWGQTLKTPTIDNVTPTITSAADFLNGTADFVETDNTTDASMTHTKNQGALRTSAGTGTAGDNVILSRTITALSAGDESSLRFSFQGSNLQAYGDDTDSDTFVFRLQGQSGSGKEFAIWSGGIYYKQDSDSKYVLVTGSEIAGNGPWVTIEVRVDDAAGSTTVYLNDVLLQTLTSADLKDASLTGTSAFEFYWETDSGTEIYTTQLVMAMYNDTITTPFAAVAITALNDFQYLTPAGTNVYSLLAAAGDYIYHDNHLYGIWRPLRAKANSTVYFTKYRTTMVWSDNNGGSAATVWQWDGREDPEELDDAPPVRFLVEHQQRLFGWGDTSNPRRVYFSADRQPDVWFSPSPTNIEDQFDEALDAGYLELPSKAAAVTAAWGDYFGLAVIFAERGIWKLSGNGVFSYRLEGITLKNGAINADCVTQVGNDLWALSRQGIVSLAASEQFGDLKIGYPSGPIQNLWADDISTDTSINQTFITRSKMTFNSRSGFLYIATPSAVQQQPGQVHFFNANTEKWFGPWTIDTQSMVDAVVASPVTEVVMIGDQDGQIGYLNPFDKSDYGAGYTFKVESVAHDGRSLDPSLRGMVKTWKALRLFLLPRGDYEYDVTWWTDDKPNEDSRSRSQIKGHTQYLTILDDNFRLDVDPDGILQAGETAITHDIPLDVRGKWLTFKIEQDGVGHDIALQGYELEFLVAGYEEE